ncbi:MAG: IS4 family transposase [Candidatus Omnitrophica bacterium]|nr:IS4 family transposase [Candidatus Omnitrophota bacterium]
MAHYTTIMNELLHLIPRHRFETVVNNLSGNRYVKHFDCWNQFTVLLYAQASAKDSLRDIEQAFKVNSERLYHLGLPAIKRSTLADANKTRSYHIFESLFYRLLERCKDITPKHKFKFKNPLYTLDATIIDLCLAAFPWAKFRTAKGALKLHYQFDHSGSIPSFLVVTDAKQHEVQVAQKNFAILSDSIYCFDKGYLDFGWFRRLKEAKSYFVTRAKDNLNYEVIGQHNQTNKKGVLSDEIIRLSGYYQSKDYPGSLRLIRYYDKETDKTLIFLTNNFSLCSLTIAQIYKARWQIEIFFKWIKQNLKIKTFLGTSKNAVLTQIWVAMCYYLLLAYVKYQTQYKYSLFYLHRVIKETLLSRYTLIDLLHASEKILPKLKREEFQYAFL